MRIERTEDVAFIRSVIEHDAIKEFLIDDLHEGDIPIPLHPRYYYLVPIMEIGVEPGMIEDRRVGCLFFAPVNGVTWNPHIAILPQYRGRGTEAMMGGVLWMFTHTACRKVVAHPPAYNLPMVRVFEKCGFKREGLSRKSVLRHGVLHDRILMGLDKES